MLGAGDQFVWAVARGAQEPPLPWASELVVRRGSPQATEVILIRATNDGHGLPERVGAAWADGASELGTPWIAVARTETAFAGILSYFDEPLGLDPDHDRLARQIDALLPLGSSWLTIVEAGDTNQDAMVELSADPPNHGGDAVSACMMEIRRRGVNCVEPELDESWMYTEVDYATGERGSEQVLGWDDMYTAGQWTCLRDAGRLFVRIRPDAGLVEPKVVELVANAVSVGRRELDAYYAGETHSRTRNRRNGSKRMLGRCPLAAHLAVAGGPIPQGVAMETVLLTPLQHTAPCRRRPTTCISSI